MTASLPHTELNMFLLKGQKNISPQRGMPVDDKGTSSTVATVSNETVQLYYFDNTILTSDVDSAIGTVVVGFLANDNIKNAMGTSEGSKANTSLSFTSTALTTERQITEELIEDNDANSYYTTATVVTGGFANGEYCVDYSKGIIYGKKASTTNTLTSTTYKIKQGVVGGSSSVPSSMDLIKVGGTAITLGQKTSALSIPVVMPSDAAASTGSASSGDNTYMSPTDFTATYASATTLTLTGLSFTPVTAQFMSVKVQPASGVSVTYTPDVKVFSYNSTTGVLTVTGATFLNTDTYVVTLVGPKKAPYDSGSQSELVNPIWSVSDQYLAETLVDTTNVAAATTYYPSASGLSMDGYRNLSLEGLISGGVTTTIEVTNDDAASPDWLDITDSLYNWITGGTRYATSWVDTNFLFQMDNVNFKNIRIKSVTSDATNAVQYNLRRTY
jgi:hypothetical protein